MWPSIAPALSGTEVFAHNGVPASTDDSQIRVDPSAAYNPATKEIFLSWQEQDSLQFYSGVFAQKFDASGNRMWTDTGLVIVPLQSNDAEIFERTVQVGDGAFVFWIDEQLTMDGTIQAVKLDGKSNLLCQQFGVATAIGEKASPWADIAGNGLTAIAFEDYRNGNSDIYIQNVNQDCSLGKLTRSGHQVHK